LARRFKAIVLKEIKELVRDPRILVGVILVPLVIFPLIGGLSSIAMESAQREVASIRVALVDEDRSQYSSLMHDVLKYMPNVVLVDVEGANWMDKALTQDVRAVMRIPEGFGENLSKGLRGEVELYVVVKSLSVGESGVQGTLNEALSYLSRALSTVIISAHAPSLNATNVLSPMIVKSMAVFKGEVVNTPPERFVSSAIVQSFMMPIMMLIIMLLASQTAVTSIAIEKEEKTLETLLTLPVKRVTVLWGKLVGSTIVAALAVLAYVAGFSYYMMVFLPVRQVSPSGASLSVSIGGYVVLATSLFLSLISLLALSLLLGAYAQDVRSAQSLFGLVFIPIFVPAFVLMYADISALPLGLQIVLYAIPFSHPMIAAKAMFVGDYIVPLLGILYNAAFTVLVLLIATRFFSSEKVVTARIALKKGAETT
jgi:ABC-2 type transport system permease protein